MLNKLKGQTTETMEFFNFKTLYGSMSSMEPFFDRGEPNVKILS